MHAVMHYIARWPIVVAALSLQAGVGAASHQAPPGETKAIPSPNNRAHTTPEEAKPYLGEWTSRVIGPSGPIDFLVEIKVTGGEVRAKISSALLVENEIRGITTTDKGIVVKYTGEIWGYVWHVVVTF